MRDHHVAAVAAAPLEVAATCGVWLRRRDHLEELVTDGEERVLETEARDAGIAIADLEPEHVAEVVDDRLELRGDQRDLAEAETHERPSLE